MLKHIPNFLTGLRLALAPATAAFVAYEHFMAAFGVFAVAGLTDAVDGALARGLHARTRFGKILDPIADKTLMIVSFIALTVIGNVPLWLTTVVIGRDALIGAGYGIALMRGVKLDTTPLAIGKATTLVQVGYLALHLAALAFGFSMAPVTPFDAYLVAAVTALSGGAYFWRWIGAMRRGPQKRA